MEIENQPKLNQNEPEIKFDLYHIQLHATNVIICVVHTPCH